MIDKVLDWISSLNSSTASKSLRVTLHGGEPLTIGRQGLEHIFEGLQRRLGSVQKIQWSMQSNLWLLDTAVCRLLAKNNVRVGTSLDGPEKINDAQRGRGYFTRTLQGIRLLQAHGIRVSCIATFTPNNIAHWRDVFHFFLDADVDFAIHPSVPSLERSHALDLSPAQYGDLLCAMLEEYLIHCHKIRIPTLDRYCNAVAHGVARECTFRKCLGMFLAVDPYGEIYSCQRFAGQRHFSLGHIDSRPALDALMQSRSAGIFRRWQNRRRDECASCRDKSICHGGCPYQAWANGFSYDSRDPYCRAYRQVFQHIRDRIETEIATPVNMQAIVSRPWNGRGNPLLAAGPVIDLVKDEHHPKVVAKHARRIVTAHALARENSLRDAAEAMVSNGIYPDPSSATCSLVNMRRRMESSTQRLRNLYLHVTWRCQLACAHCYAKGPDRKSITDISLDHFNNAASAGVDMGFRQIIVTGGEPLMHPRASRMMRQILMMRKRSTTVKWVLRTNWAQPIDDVEMDSIAFAFDAIVVSLDGEEEAHDAQRGKGMYQLTVGNLQRYQAHFFQQGKGVHQRVDKAGSRSTARLCLACTQTPEKLEGVSGQHVRELAKRLGIRNVRLRPVLPIGRADAAKNAAEPFKGVMLADPMQVVRHGLDPIISCGLGQNLSIEPNGDAYPCHVSRSINALIGNVFTQGTGVQEIVRRANLPSRNAGSVDQHPLCSPCEYRYLCGGLCKAWTMGAKNLAAGGAFCGRLYSYFGKLTDIAKAYLIKKSLMQTQERDHHVAP